jgi:Protein of unknown function (DUF993)
VTTTAVGSGVVVDLPDTTVELREPVEWRRPSGPLESRVAFAAVHVVPKVLADSTPGRVADLDWDHTLASRHRIWEFGLGVAEAMDTAQRGMGLDWAATQELIRRSCAEARSVGGRIACGAGTDQIEPDDLAAGTKGLDQVVAAYCEQIDLVSSSGGQVIVMASRALARVARSAEDYLAVYDAILRDGDAPVILHWLGQMFDPALAGYWGSDQVSAATETFLELLRLHADRIDGVKVSLLDAEHEKRLRRSMAPIRASDGRSLRLYTGDDFNYPELVAGDGRLHSDALLGIFAAIYPAASAAIQCLDDGDDATAHELLASTERLGRHVFEAPTYYYKTGIAFLSWLNGHQPGFQMVAGLHGARSVRHLSRVLVLADECGLLRDPDLAASRMRSYLDVAGWRP